WVMMDRWREQGIDSLAIPHNSNGSGGRMFELEYYEGGAIVSMRAGLRIRITSISSAVIPLRFMIGTAFSGMWA
ncbi:MAG: DUF3604 domain-containing protein, partial [Gemmatimonadetes bacterium]|nr:DUF3604 domain-containing protein [Gemmatimonadota bacterium]